MGRSQEVVFCGIKQVRSRFPFAFREIHSDNGTEFINWHLLKYTNKEGLGFSRSRPNKKNDNCFVEQKNWTHVKKFVGYFRYETTKELDVINDLYRSELGVYKNFFQPVIKLVSKERRGGRVHRKYDDSKTPYHRLMESSGVEVGVKKDLTKIYEALNPAKLKKQIDEKINKLYKIYQKKNKSHEIQEKKKLRPNLVTYLIAEPSASLVT